MKQDIWILEDGKVEADLYRAILSNEYAVTVFESLTPFTEALLTPQRFKLPALLIADLKLSKDEDFSEFISSEKHRALLRMPFIVTSSLDCPQVMQFCLAAGASDYLVKPFNRNELMLKVKRVLSLKPSLTNHAELGDDLKYTLKERIIIEEFLKNPARTVARTQIADRLWPGVKVEYKTLDVHMSNLRKKLQASGYTIMAGNPKEWTLKEWDGVEIDNQYLVDDTDAVTSDKKQVHPGIRIPPRKRGSEASDALL